MEGFGKKRALKFAFISIAITLVFGLVMLYGCAFYNLFGIACPACGVTRAWLRFFKFDIRGAIEYHAFFMLIPLYVFLFALRDMRFMKKFRKAADAFLYIFTAVLVIYNIYRNCFV